ncbi:MTA1-like protein, partial [Mya arenaria]
MAANMYRVGDYVFFETASTAPYQIRRIEELNKTPNGNVEAKVMCFYRRRDISSSLTLLADKHQMTAVGDGNVDEEGEKEETDQEVSDKQRHQLKHRELFLSRQVETLPATHIRGKCAVTLLNETEALTSYLDREDTFFYSLVYDPQQKTLLADKGEIRVGSKYQCDIQPLLQEGETDGRNVEESVGTFARALDCTSTVRQPSLHMSSAAASRDITLFNAMHTLHGSSYDIGKAIGSLVPPGGPVLCRDEMEEWSASEANLFEEALDKYGKDFIDIRQDFLPWKSLKSIIEYYYINKPNPAAINGKMNGIDGQVSGRACESCYAAHSSQWYAWGPTHMQCRLCSSCWIYWKKYGGLKMPTRLDGERPAPAQRQERVAQNNLLRIHRCTITGCGKEFRSKQQLARHLATAHGLAIRAGSPRPVMKTRAAFCLVTTSLTRISRYLCKDLLRPRHASRCPFIPINIAVIKQECQDRLTEKGGDYKLPKHLTARTRIQPVVGRLGIDVNQEKPAILERPDGPAKQPDKLMFPPLSPSKQKPLDVVNKSPVSGPSIMKKRGYEHSNGIDSGELGPAAKRPNMGLLRQQANLALRQQMRPNILGQHINGRGKMLPKGLRIPMISWIDAPDDVYFISTSATKKIRKQLQGNEFRRTARNPWRIVRVKPQLGEDVVNLPDWFSWIAELSQLLYTLLIPCRSVSIGGVGALVSIGGCGVLMLSIARDLYLL